jgi:transposase InsO family protein
MLSPSAAWTVQQLREAFPWDRAPRYLIRDRDHAFEGWAESAKARGIEEVLTAPRSPWQNAYAERFIGSIRRECLDHVMVFGVSGLQRLIRRYCEYYERSRTHRRFRPAAAFSQNATSRTVWPSLTSGRSPRDQLREHRPIVAMDLQSTPYGLFSTDS